MRSIFPYIIPVILVTFFACSGSKQAIKTVKEQDITVSNPQNKVLIHINAPDGGQLQKHKQTLLVFFALPNGNSIEWTMGKQLQPGDDWHFDIQHIAAQTRYIRHIMKNWNIIVVYMATQQKSWPAWKRETPGAPQEIKRIVDSVTGVFASYHPHVMLNSHSGGGSFIFGYLDAVKEIPGNIQRIAFIDSDYGYEDSLHGTKLTRWLQASRQHYLTVLAYNDSVVVYNNKPIVSPTGGTWYRSKMMQRKLGEAFVFQSVSDTAFIHYTALNNRIDIRLKENPYGKIYHTEQVARNGFIHTVLSGTKYEAQAGYTYWGDRAYMAFIDRE